MSEFCLSVHSYGEVLSIMAGEGMRRSGLGLPLFAWLLQTINDGLLRAVLDACPAGDAGKLVDAGLLADVDRPDRACIFAEAASGAARFGDPDPPPELIAQP